MLEDRRSKYDLRNRIPILTEFLKNSFLGIAVLHVELLDFWAEGFPLMLFDTTSLGDGPLPGLLVCEPISHSCQRKETIGT